MAFGDGGIELAADPQFVGMFQHGQRGGVAAA